MRKYVGMALAVAVLLVSFAALAQAQSAVRTGEITTIAADTKSITVKTARGETNVTTTDKTMIMEGDKHLKFADLKVGDNVKVSGVRKDADVEAEEITRTPK